MKAMTDNKTVQVSDWKISICIEAQSYRHYDIMIVIYLPPATVVARR